MSRLEIRLLGGFDVRLGSQTVEGFESQKVRALLAYLACHRSKPMSRDRLASLLWGDKPEEAARRNLRQALHNLRSTFSAVEEPDKIVEVSHTTLRLAPEMDCWVDAESFERAYEAGFAEALPDLYQLGRAARIYSGDFLAGFYVKQTPGFEEWLVVEQERLREAAIETYRTLIDTYLKRGEYHLGIQYARRLLAIDPLSEGAHRYLMRLYAQSGRRVGALSQYEKLRSLLADELGVEPLEETTQLYESILVQELPEQKDQEIPAGPLIPMVGRRGPYSVLQEHWQAVLRGRGRLTLLGGEEGVGKTRLAKSFVDAMTSKRTTVVLSGRAASAAPLISRQPFGEIVLGAFAEMLPEDHQELAQELSPEIRTDLLMLCPQLADVAPEMAVDAEPDPERLADSLLAYLEALGLYFGSRTDPVPLILLVDDLHWADRATLQLIGDLVPKISASSIWILATAVNTEAALDHWLAALDGESARVDHITLDRLNQHEVLEIASTLLGISSSPELGDFLAQWSSGLPLAVAELINFLWDEGHLVPGESGLWSLRRSLEEIEPPPDSVDKLVRNRIRRLPTSARRLLSLAAVFGQQFDAEALQNAAGEHMAVVDIAIQLMIERWLVRQSPISWTHSPRERDLVLWARGARRGTFEFAHESIRKVALEEINPIRRQVLHRAAAEVLRGEQLGEEPYRDERVAFHDMAAGEWQSALPHLATAAKRALEAGAAEAAQWYVERGMEAANRLGSQAASAAERKRISKSERELAALADRIPV